MTEYRTTEELEKILRGARISSIFIIERTSPTRGYDVEFVYDSEIPKTIVMDKQLEDIDKRAKEWIFARKRRNIIKLQSAIFNYDSAKNGFPIYTGLETTF